MACPADAGWRPLPSRPAHSGRHPPLRSGCSAAASPLRVQPSLGPAEIQIADDLYIGPLTAEQREGSMIFSNHSCNPNIGVQGQIVFAAMRDIAAGEELTHDWATTDCDDYEMACNCGASGCRKVITGRDWMKPELQEKYRGYFSWYLERKIQAEKMARTAAR